MARLSNRWDIPLLLVLGVVWASAFSMIKIAVPATGPVLLVFIRCTIGAAVMLALVATMKATSAWPQTWRQWSGLVLVGIMSTALPFYLISFAEQEISSSMTAILMSTGPLVVVILGHIFTDDEKINRGKIIGVLIGLIATLYLLKDGFSSFNGYGFLYPLAAVAAATCYAIGGIAAKKLTQVSAEVIAAMVLVSSALVVFPFTLTAPVKLADMSSFDYKVILALVWLGVMPSGLAFYLRYFLIKRCGYGFVSYVGYLIPLFATVMGLVLLGEQITFTTVIAMLFIILGLFFTRSAADPPWSLSAPLRQFRNHIG